MTTAKHSYIVGIDYSMNSPAICIHKGYDWSVKNCSFNYFTGVKKFQTSSPNISGSPIPIYQEKDDLARWEANADWAINILNSIKDNITAIAIEGYSYGSKGSLPFNIAENTVILKYKLRKLLPNVRLNIFAPGAIKKNATGKGNAKKIQMWESFLADTKFDLTKVINSKPDGNPISDVVDSYWICKLLHLTIHGN